VRAFIVGTAGHIDHGKSALVRALTGTDPDRLKEEQERGITIDLGFAHCELPGGRTASFIDVPGHERFVRNMLAGAHGLDAVLLVVAADESVMPQTREHFHICRLLGLRHGLIALTKCDLADADSQALSELEARELVAGSFLEGAPVVRVSARTGAGLDALRAELQALGDRVAERASDGLLRLPLDRVFTLRGFGTVVTGTMVAGTLASGEEVEILPAGRRARVRALHVHGRAQERAEAGTRTAVNLAGVDVAELQRGDVLARPGTLRATSLLDVEITPLAGQRLRDQRRVRVHVSSAEVLARVRRLEPRASAGDEAQAPAEGAFVAQLRLEAPAVAGRGDNLILRSYSPATTIAGALVLDPAPPKRKAAAPTVSRARALIGAGPREAARLYVEEAGEGGIDGTALAARVTLPLPALRAALLDEPRVVALGGEPGVFVARAALDERAAQALALLERFHADHPLKAALHREELKRRAFEGAAEGAFERVLDELSAAGRVRVLPDAVALARHAVTLTPAEQQARETLVAAAREAGFRGLEAPERAVPGVGRGPADARLVERIVKLLLAEGELRRVGDDLLLHREHLEALKLEVRRRWPPGSRLDVAGLKELTGLSRKFVIPLLEYLDRERVTRRAGADRVVLA
jgi:selenocysteine-specific elongation factor